jgi:tetratricopeptide (TPR) repeat protein
MRSLKKLLFVVTLFTAAGAYAQTLDEGLKAWRNENYITARDIFKKVTDADPGNATALFHYGESLFKTGDVAGAQAAFDKGALARPNEFLCVVGQAKCLLEAGDVAGADKKIAAALKGTKNKDQSIFSAAAEAYSTTKTKDWVKAIDYAQKGIATPKGKLDFNSYNALGDVYFEKHYSGNGDEKDIGLAVSNYEKAYSFNKSSPYAMTRIGRIWSTTKTDLSYRSCIEALDKAKEVDPDYLPMHSVYSTIYEKSGQFDKAKTELEIYMAGCEDKVKPNDRMINILYQLKDWKGALALAEKMYALFPENCDYIRVLAHVNTELGQVTPKDSVYYKAAMGYFNLYTSKCGSDKMKLEDYNYLAKVNLNMGNDTAAVRYYNQVIGLDSTKEQPILKEMASGFFLAKKFAPAIEAYKRLMEKYPTTNTLFKLMDSYYYAKLWKETGVTADSFIVNNPGNPLGYLYKARALYYTDTLDFRKASIDGYKLYLEKTQDTAFTKQVMISEKTEAHQQIAYYYIKKKNYKAALEELNVALVEDPTNKIILSLKEKVEKALKPQPQGTKPTPGGQTPATPK